MAGPSHASTPAALRPAATTLLLPARDSLQGEPVEAPLLARVFARADRTIGEAGDEVQIQRHVDLLPRGLPIAAITRDFDCADAQHHAWLRADPAHVRADMGTGRLLACGDLGLTREEAEALIAPLKPLFGDGGCPISVGAESRWYLALPRDSRLPPFPPPSRVLGDDIFAHLPAGDLGRRWRRLLSEAQVALHHHPLNAARVAAGKLPVNSLWFWGAGALPDHVRVAHRSVLSDDLLLIALARRAGVADSALPPRFDMPAGGLDAMIDLRRVRQLATLERDWIAPFLQFQSREKSLELRVDFADGLQLRYLRKHRWRVWRRPASTLR